MKPVCIIPARAGSKGLPNKNMLFLDGKPMIFHTIDAAIESGCFAKEDIYVSTDSPLYKEICESKGIRVLLRPKELALDTTTSYEVNEEFLKDFDDDQVFVLLQVTSPLRTGAHIREALRLYESEDVENVVSFVKVDKSPILFTELDDNGYAKDIVGVGGNYRRQNDPKKLYMPNGAIYISSKAVYLKYKTYFSPKTKAYLMDKASSVDVDDREDFLKIIGSIYFDYPKREKRSKHHYRTLYQQFLESDWEQNIILGDSRLCSVAIPAYTNLSLGGVTLATVVENSDSILQKPLSSVLISLGINDIITAYELEDIKENYRNLFTKCRERHISIFVTTVAYALFRDRVDNSRVEELNKWLMTYCAQEQIALLDVNQTLSQDGHLKFAYTSDGLHFNEEGTQVLLEELLHFVTPS